MKRIFGELVGRIETKAMDIRAKEGFEDPKYERSVIRELTNTTAALTTKEMMMKEEEDEEVKWMAMVILLLVVVVVVVMQKCGWL